MKRGTGQRSLLGKFILHFSTLAVVLLSVFISCILFFMLRAARLEVAASNQAFLTRAGDAVDSQMALINHYALRVSTDTALSNIPLLNDPARQQEALDYRRYVYPLAVMDDMLLYYPDETPGFVFSLDGVYRSAYFDACFSRYGLSLNMLAEYAQGLRAAKWFYAEDSRRLIYACPLAYRDGKAARAAFFIINAESILDMVRQGLGGTDTSISLSLPDFTLEWRQAEGYAVLPELREARRDACQVSLVNMPMQITAYTRFKAAFPNAWLLLSCVGAACLIAFALVYLLSRRSYHPIGTLVTQLSQQGQGAGEADAFKRYDDLRAIRDGYERALADRRVLAAELDKNTRLMYSNVLPLLLYGKHDGIDEASAREATHLSPAHTVCRLVYVMVDRAGEILQDGGRAAIEGLQDEVWQAFHALSQDDAISVATSAFLYGKYATMLLSFRPEFALPALHARLAAIQAHVQAKAGHTVTLVLSAPFERLTEIQTAYAQVRQSAQARILTGWNALIMQENPPAPQDARQEKRVRIDDLIALCLIPDEDGARAALERYFLQRCAKPDEVAFRSAYYRLLSALQGEAARYGDARQTLYEPETIADATQYLGGVIGELCAGVREEKNGARALPAKRARERLEACFSDAQLTVAGLCDAVGAPEGTLRREFKAAYGVTIPAYLDSLRMACVKRLLIDTELPLKDIVEQAGFADASNLIRKFKHAEGETPTAYRKRLRGMVNSTPK